MNNDLNKIFEESQCPGSEKLQDYLDGKLSGREKHQVEKHLTDCEMCSDELEGLKLLKNRKDLDKIVGNIKSRSLTDQVRKVTFINKYKIYLAAAAVVILAAIIIILKNESLSEHQPLVADKTEIITEKTDEKVVSVSEDDDKVSAGEKSPKQIIEKEGKGKSETEAYITPTDNAEEEKELIDVSEDVADIIGGITTDEEKPGDMGAVAAEEIVISQPEITVIEKIAESEPKKDKTLTSKEEKSEKSYDYSEDEVKVVNEVHSRNAKAPAAMNVETTIAKGSKSGSADKIIDKAMEKFKEEKYRSALKIFEDIIYIDSTNYEAMYYAAYCYNELKNEEKALYLLDRILEDNNNAYYNNAFVLRKEILKE